MSAAIRHAGSGGKRASSVAFCQDRHDGSGPTLGRLRESGFLTPVAKATHDWEDADIHWRSGRLWAIRKSAIPIIRVAGGVETATFLLEEFDGAIGFLKGSRQIHVSGVGGESGLKSGEGEVGRDQCVSGRC